MHRVLKNMRLRRVANAGAVVTLTLTLSGCPSPAVFRLSSVDSPDAALRARASVLRDEPALSDEAMPSEWWQLLGDATLSELQSEAASTSLDLQSAAIRVEESSAQLGLIDAARRPQIAAEAAYVRSALSEYSPFAKLGAPTTPVSTWTLGLQAGWELDLWGRLSRQSESAEARVQASVHGMDAVRVSVAGEIARIFLLLRGAQAQTKIVEENRQIAGELVRLAESRQRNGIATRFDAAAARADEAGIEARLAQLQQQRDALMNALAMLLGRGPR